jgi:hypothetical protein
MSSPRSPLAASLVSIADHAGNAITPRHAETLYLAADWLDDGIGALRALVETCETDEVQGYRSALRIYVLDIVKPVLARVPA